MSKIIGLDSAYADAIEKRGRNMLISANLVSEMVDRIRELEASHDALKDICSNNKEER